MDMDLIEIDAAEPINIAFSSSALFDQYDDLESIEEADCYENLYPNVG